MPTTRKSQKVIEVVDSSDEDYVNESEGAEEEDDYESEEESEPQPKKKKKTNDAPAAPAARPAKRKRAAKVPSKPKASASTKKPSKPAPAPVITVDYDTMMRVVARLMSGITLHNEQAIEKERLLRDQKVAEAEASRNALELEKLRLGQGNAQVAQA